ncbi:hypothetical protein [Bacillus sp. KH172YL63]|uniref:hypothetical protein n=1 Tax=Bacillus sp. KH172YL63 TaxID=2709784 RepID=UPI0013E475B0|nr:hypothetical protein [Bacillus sp. KH172YL63]BCB04525.1 hypothetical protein KH172YL63_26580 [Bacillus sp. KH172YL63]
MGTYIIENANWVKEEKVIQTSMLVEDHKVSALRDSFAYYRHMRMDVSPFMMTPGHVMCDLDVPEGGNFPSVKEYYLSKFIHKGCTTVLTAFSLSYEYEFMKQLQERKTSLINCPLDYTIGLILQPKLITPSIIRSCKRHRVPVIWIRIDELESFKSIPWGWIKGLLYDYPITFVPFFSTPMDNKTKMKHLKIWQTSMDSERIPHLSYEIPQNKPMTLDALKKIGIYPHRGTFLAGGELSYNLYMKSHEELGDEPLSSLNDHHVLKCTMNKGKYQFVNDKGYFYPGAGVELIIQTPGYFT